jgi:hypothetical protein
LSEKVENRLELHAVKVLLFPEWAIGQFVWELQCHYHALHRAEFVCPAGGLPVYQLVADVRVQPFGHWPALWWQYV